MASLTAEQCRELFALNPDGSLVWISQRREHQAVRGKPAGTPSDVIAHRRWHVVVFGHGLKRSRIVFCMTRGRWPEKHIDHINGDSLDDRPENLREATQAENCWNRIKFSKPSGLPIGVKRCPKGKFQARIRVSGKTIHLGSFHSIEAAQTAYIAAKHHHCGEFVRRGTSHV